jgi:hypothetical protein
MDGVRVERVRSKRDLAPDGRFFLIRSVQEETGGTPAANLIVVQHWFEELKRLVPTK